MEQQVRDFLNWWSSQFNWEHRFLPESIGLALRVAAREWFRSLGVTGYERGGEWSYITFADGTVLSINSDDGEWDGISEDIRYFCE